MIFSGIFKVMKSRQEYRNNLSNLIKVNLSILFVNLDINTTLMYFTKNTTNIMTILFIPFFEKIENIETSNIKHIFVFMLSGRKSCSRVGSYTLMRPNNALTVCMAVYTKPMKDKTCNHSIMDIKEAHVVSFLTEYSMEGDVS